MPGAGMALGALQLIPGPKNGFWCAPWSFITAKSPDASWCSNQPCLVTGQYWFLTTVLLFLQDHEFSYPCKAKHRDFRVPSLVCLHDVVLATLQQAVVGLDLLLQATLDIQEGLVFLVLALHFRSDLSQPLLHAGDLVLQLSQVFVVATFSLRQRGFQVLFLRIDQTYRCLGLTQVQL